MSRSATLWLVAAAVAAGFFGVVLKATDVRRPARSVVHDVEPPTPAPASRQPAPVASAPGAEPSAVVAPAPEQSDAPADDAVAAAPSDDGAVPAPPRRPGPAGESESRVRGRVLRRHLAILERQRRAAEGGSLHAGKVGDDGDAALGPTDTASTRTAHQAPAAAAAPATAEPGEHPTPGTPPPTDITFASGADRQYPTDTPVEIADTPNLAGASGTMSFWLQPTWQDGNQDDASLLELGDGRLRIVKNVDFLRFEWTDDAGTNGGIGAPITDWKPGEWHAVTTTWNGTSYALYIDGRLVSEKSDAGLVGLPSDATLMIGSNFAENRPVAPGVIGNIDVRRRPLSAGEVANQFAAVTNGGTAGAASSGGKR